MHSQAFMAQAVRRLHIEVRTEGERYCGHVLHVAKAGRHVPPPGAYGGDECRVCGAAVWQCRASDRMMEAVAGRRIAPLPVCCCCVRRHMEAGGPVITL